jgi:hypothetical protein
VKFVPNVPVATSEPTMVVDAGLAVGTHRFQLVVFNARGQASKPQTFDVVIEPRLVVPVTPITPIRPPLP